MERRCFSLPFSRSLSLSLCSGPERFKAKYLPHSKWKIITWIPTFLLELDEWRILELDSVSRRKVNYRKFPSKISLPFIEICHFRDKHNFLLENIFLIKNNCILACRQLTEPCPWHQQLRVRQPHPIARWMQNSLIGVSIRRFSNNSIKCEREKRCKILKWIRCHSMRKDCGWLRVWN